MSSANVLGLLWKEKKAENIVDGLVRELAILNRLSAEDKKSPELGIEIANLNCLVAERTIGARRRFYVNQGMSELASVFLRNDFIAQAYGIRGWLSLLAAELDANLKKRTESLRAARMSFSQGFSINPTLRRKFATQLERVEKLSDALIEHRKN